MNFLKNYKTYIISIIFIIILIFLAYRKGLDNGFKLEKDKYIDDKLKVLVIKSKITQKQIDSIKSLQPEIYKEKRILIKSEKIIKDSIKKIVIEKPKDTICNELYVKSSKKINLLEKQISIKDSIEHKSNRLLSNQDLIISKQDSLIKNMNSQINLIKDKKIKTKKFGVGVNVGYGIYIKNKQIEYKPYIGVGISYNFLNF